jgi:hypothetical protein
MAEPAAIDTIGCPINPIRTKVTEPAMPAHVPNATGSPETALFTIR